MTGELDVPFLAELLKQSGQSNVDLVLGQEVPMLGHELLHPGAHQSPVNSPGRIAQSDSSGAKLHPSIDEYAFDGLMAQLGAHRRR